MAIFEIAQKFAERLYAAGFHIAQAFADSFNRFPTLSPKHDGLFGRKFRCLAGADSFANKMMKILKRRSVVNAHSAPWQGQSSFITAYRSAFDASS